MENARFKSDWQVRAAAYELMALSFRYPDQMLVDALVLGEYGEAFTEISDALGLGGEVEHVSGDQKLDSDLSKESAELLAGYKDADPDALLHALRAEATRLFIGAPEPVVSPYEGVWRAADDGVQALLFVNPHSMDVERFMKVYGIGQAPGRNEPLDHVSTELEFLMYLALLEAEMTEPAPGIDVPENGWAAVHDHFLEEHVNTWIPRFADEVTAQTRELFYQAAGEMLTILLKK